MAELLPEEIDSEVARLFNEGESLLDADDVDQALARFQAAWGLIPEPKGHWQRALQVLCAIADCQYFLCEDESCISTLHLALRMDGGARTTPGSVFGLASAACSSGVSSRPATGWCRPWCLGAPSCSLTRTRCIGSSWSSAWP